MNWIRVDVGLGRHPKLGRLARRLGIPRYAALGLLTALWSWVGELWGDDAWFDVEPEELAEAVHWTEDPGELLQALVEVGWLDRAGGGFEVHGWEEYQSADARARALARRRKRRQRERERKAESLGRHDDVTPDRDTTSRGDVTGCHATHPPTDVRTSSSGGNLEGQAQAPEGSKSTQASPGLPSIPTPPSKSRKGKSRTPSPKILIDLWREKLPHLRQPTTWSDRRKRLWRARCREPGFLEHLPEVIDKIAASPFLTGQVPPKPPHTKPFVADIDWLLDSDNWVKVFEGKYDEEHQESDGVSSAVSLRKKIARVEAMIDRTESPDLKAELQVQLEDLRRRLEEAE